VAASSCVAQSQVITEDNQALSPGEKTRCAKTSSTARASVTTDQEQLASDEANAVSAEQALSNGRSPRDEFEHHLHRAPRRRQKFFVAGQSVYSLDGSAVPLFYGATPFLPRLYLGEAGPDVTETARKISSRSASGAGLRASGLVSTLRPSRHSRPGRDPSRFPRRACSRSATSS